MNNGIDFIDDNWDVTMHLIKKGKYVLSIYSSYAVQMVLYGFMIISYALKVGLKTFQEAA